MSKQKKVLIISYLFPPIGGGGVQRALKMVKYLPKYGWNPVVLTVDPTYDVSLDESLLKQIPQEVKVYRAKEINPYHLLRGMRTSGGRDAKKAPNKKQTKEADNLQQKTASVRSRLKKAIFSLIKKIKNILLIPDDQILWVPFAILKGRQAIKEQQIDAIFSTSGPYSVHLVAQALAKKTGLPWIADYRDPWTQNMHRSGIAWREKLEERMERNVMKKADVVTTVTHTFAANFIQKFPEIKRIEVIHNGFDPADYLGLQERPNKDQLTFSYTGIFYQERNPRLFLRAVAELIAEGKVDRQDLSLRFAGVFDYPGYSDNIEAVKGYGLEDVVEVLGHLPHQEALTLLKSSDVLLLVGDTAEGSGAYIPGKLFEYMAVKKPILSLSLPGESTKIIQTHQLGQVVNPTDLEAIKSAVFRFYQWWKEHRLDQQFAFDLQPERLLIYQRDDQAKRLADVLNSL